MRYLLKDEKFISAGATLLIHGLVVVFLLLIHVDFRPKIAEFLEVSFSGAPVPPARGKQNPTAPPPKAEAAGNGLTSEPISTALSNSIALPERRESNLPEEEILEKLQPEREKQFEGPPALKKKTALSLPRKSAPATLPLFNKQEKTAEKLLFTRAADKPARINGKDTTPLLANRNIEIDWQGEIQREVYQQRLPEFPPDVQHEAVIKIRFTVLPNGLVGSAIPVQKGDTRLENLTLEAFRTWRFNPLPSYVEQKTQQGVITFRFKLK